MRVVAIFVAALLTLGLAAFGIVISQRGNVPSLASLLPSRATPAAPAAAPAPVPAAPQVARVTPSSPVTQIAQQVAQATVSDAPAPALVEPAAPTRVAQNSGPVTPDRFQQSLPPSPATSAPKAPAPSAAAPAPSAAPQAAATPAQVLPACSNPDGIGISRIVEIDTTGGPAFGTEHFKQYDFLRDHEVVLTFDDGPWKGNTPAVLKALQDNCTKATFFEIGEHATWYPEISKMVAAAGMTIGSHTWSHKDLAKNPYAKDIEQAKQEIEMGVSAVSGAVGGPIAPFFRFPDLQQPPDMIAYLGTRNIATFSADIDTTDFKLNKPDAVIKSVMTKLAKSGKGILLMHDFRQATAEAMPEILKQLKAGGYKIVHMVPKDKLASLPKYDEMVRAKDKFSNANNSRPESSVVKTISQ
jgi:peptidoglycan/xylan/chitin deacetylase (PgdA/CDA1 family)